MSEAFSRLHTLLTLAAFLAALLSFIKNKEINSFNRLGRAYILTTILACGIPFTQFLHSDLTPVQGFSLSALLALIVAALGERVRLFGPFSSDIAIKSYTISVTFQLMATANKLALSNLPTIYFSLILISVIGASLQIRRHRILTRAQAKT